MCTKNSTIQSRFCLVDFITLSREKNIDTIRSIVVFLLSTVVVIYVSVWLPMFFSRNKHDKKKQFTIKFKQRIYGNKIYIYSMVFFQQTR